jgi:hypothetical protein
MCDSCCLDPEALDQLVAEDANDDKEPFDPDYVGDPPLFDGQAGLFKIDADRPVWVSAGPTSVDNLNQPDAPPIAAPDLLLRDALGQLGRAFFDRQEALPIIVAWHRAITPVLLDAAGRFGDGHGPLVWVVISAADYQVMGPAVRAADWRRAVLVALPVYGVGDPRSFIAGRAVRAAIFLGGDDQGVGADAGALQHRRVPSYAIGSTGGTAGALLTNQGAAYGAQDPRVGNLLGAGASYLDLFNELVASLP